MRMFTVKLNLILLLTSLISLPSLADESAVVETSNTPISEFVAWAAREMNQPIVLGRGVTGTVSFTAPNLQPDEYLSFFNSVLYAHGYGVKYHDGLYTVVPLNDSIENLEPAFVKLYRLAHVRNSKVSDLIQSTLSATRTQSVNGSGVDNFTVEILPTTNAILVTGTESQLSKIDALISSIDVEQRQVFIEAIITETTLDDSEEIGINLQAALNKAGFIVNTSIIDTLTDNAVVYEGGDFNALVKAVKQNQHTDLLSRPNMLVMDRERGYITVGQSVPFLVSTSVSSGGVTTQEIQRQDVGVSLEVVPHIVDDNIILQLVQESQAVTNSSIAADIITNKRTLQTVVKVKDKQTIMLGGLISSDQRKGVSGVPVLMDIPILGNLFRSETTEQIRKELKIVIRTTIL